MILVMDKAPAFEETFGPLYRQARHVAWKLLGDPTEAEDAAAEAMARALLAWRKVGKLPYRDAWVMRVTANVAIDGLRRRPDRLPPAEQNDPGPGPVDFGEGVALGVDLRGALLRLSRRQREVVVLRWIGGLTEDEVSRGLGLSRSAVRTHAGRGLAAMREQLGREVDYVAL
jgi:RNA polymerase sigma factor (sigma-70 family)